MKQSSISVSSGQFKSVLAPAAAVLYTLSALLAVAGVGLLFDAEYAALLVRDRINGGIVLGSSLNTWYLIDTTITVLSLLCPAVMAAGLWAVLRGRITGGMKAVTALLQGLLWAVYGSAIVALGIFVVGMVRSIAVYLRYNEGAYYVYGLLVTEGLMAVQAWLIWLVLRKFLRESADCAYSIAYTLSSGKLDSVPIPAFPRLGLVILAAVQLVLAWDCAFTLMYVQKNARTYYELLVASHPGRYLAAATLVTGAVGDLLLSAYLRKYNRICERTRFQANRLK